MLHVRPRHKLHKLKRYKRKSPTLPAVHAVRAKRSQSDLDTQQMHLHLHQHEHVHAKYRSKSTDFLNQHTPSQSTPSLVMTDNALLKFQYRRPIEEMRRVLEQNRVHKSYLGMGYYDTLILRNMLENPSWYTPYS